MHSNELCRAVSLGAVRLVRTLLHGGFDVSTTNRDGQTALHVFCIRRDTRTKEDRDIFKLIMDSAIDVVRVGVTVGSQLCVRFCTGEEWCVVRSHAHPTG